MKYELKLTAKELDETGKEKKVTLLFLVEALSIVEACAVATKEEADLYKDMNIICVKESNISEVVGSTKEAADRFYKASIALLTINENTGAEKKTYAYILLQAEDIDDARRMAADWMDCGMIDMRLDGLVETKIVDSIGSMVE
jgi:hypothetical protein